MWRALLACALLALLAPLARAQQTSIGYVLLSNASATGSVVAWPGGNGELICSGTLGGATLTLQVLGPDGTNYVAVSTATTVSSSLPVDEPFASGVHSMRMLVAGGSPSALYCTAYVVLPAQPGLHL